MEGTDSILLSRSSPLSNVPRILFGSKPVDGGNFLFTSSEKIEFLKLEPEAEEFFKQILSGEEFLNGKIRWCLWLKEISPNRLKYLKHINERVLEVKNLRQKSTKIPTQKAADFPTVFAELRQPENDFLLIPLTSSENRKFIPIGFFSKDYIITNSCSCLQ